MGSTPLRSAACASWTGSSNWLVRKRPPFPLPDEALNPTSRLWICAACRGAPIVLLAGRFWHWQVTLFLNGGGIWSVASRSH